MLSFVSRPLDAGPAAVPVRPPRRGEVDQLVYENLCYSTPPGHRPLYLDLHVPRTEPGSEQACPLVVWVHGGGWSAGTRRRFPVGLEQAWLLERTLLAGLAVALVDYRLAVEAPYPAPVDDLRSAVRFLVEYGPQLGADPDRMALWGESAGAHLALLAARPAALVPPLRAVVDWYGPSDLTWFLEPTATAASLGGQGGESVSTDDVAVALRAAGYDVADASPVSDVSGLPPALLVHGRQDTSVPVEQSRMLRDALEAAGVLVELVETDGGHVFEGADVAVAMIDRTLDFLCDRLGAKRGPHPDAELAAALRELPETTGDDPFDTDDPHEARRRSSMFMSIVQPLRRYPIDTVRDITVEVSGREIPLRIQRPVFSSDVCVVYVHGGGWVVGDLDTHAAQAARIAATAPATVVQVHYRRAPEHPFPAAYDDTIAAVRWVAGNLTALDSRRLVLSGDSAGGNLALAAALWCRDHDVPIDALFFNYPATDWTSSSFSGLPSTYLGGDERLAMDPRVSPALGDLSGLPPVVVGVGGLDFLLDDVLTLTYRLRAARVPTSLRVFPALGHAYFSNAPLAHVADRATEQMCQDLNRLLWDGTTR